MHAGAGGGLRALQAARDQPLAEGEEADAPGILFGECRQFGAARIAPGFRPLPPVEVFTPGGARLLDGFEATVVFQRFAGGVTKTAEVFVQRMFALDETFVQRLQQPMLGFGGGRPVNQRSLFQRLEFNGQPGCIDGGAQCAFAENGARGAVKAVEK